MFQAQTLTQLVKSALATYGDRPALRFEDTVLTYAQVEARVTKLAAQFHALVNRDGRAPVIGVYGNHEPEAYFGILSGLLSGCTYVPMNPDFPAQRLAYIASDSGAQLIYVAASKCDGLVELLAKLAPGTKVLVDEIDTAIQGRFPELEFSSRSDSHDISYMQDLNVGEDDCAYILYTSGSTGRPKGVMVSQSNLACYVGHMQDRYEFNATDRFSQTYDLTFDLSALSTYCCLCCGAELHPMNKLDKLSAVRFVRQRNLTVWSSVPSLVVQMDKLRVLRPGVMPSLRVSIFCGEPLSVRSVSNWKSAANNSVVDNVYGPTEATISCSYFCWDDKAAERDYRGGIVPIGVATPGTEFALLDADDVLNMPGTEGELCIGGAQVCLGYTDPEKTSVAFLQCAIPGDDNAQRWYKTGDLVCYNPDLPGYEFIGRVDFQIKLRGHRIELAEIENVIKEAYGCDAVVVVPHPVEDGVVQGLVACIEQMSSGVDLGLLLTECRDRLPDYMCPSEFRLLDAIPLNSNGKFDRPALARLCNDAEYS